MKYKYTAFFPPKGISKWVKRPMIEAEVFGPQGSQKFNALIDSGADTSLFNIQVAELLGFDLANAKKANFTGIIGATSCYFFENVEIKLEGQEKLINLPVGFIDSDTVGLLLGQEGFFDKNRIKFEKDHDSFEVTPVKD